MDDSFILQMIADKFRYPILSNLVLILGYGIYLPLFFQSVFLVIPRLRSNVPSRWLLALIIALFVPTTVRLVSETSVTLTLLQFANFGHVDDPLATKLTLVRGTAQTARDVAFYAGQINILFIDVIVVWRAYVLLPQHRKPRTLLLVLLIFMLLSSAIGLVVRSSILCIARDVIALFVTIIGTASIGWTAWTFRKSIKEAQFLHRTTLFVVRTFRVLIEGCVILAVLQITVLGLDLTFVITGSDDFTLMSPEGILSMLLSEITILASVSAFLSIFPFILTFGCYFRQAIHPCLVTILVSDGSPSMKLAVGLSETKLSSFAVAHSTSSSVSV
ncbi:hypothetical protein DL96DRAFT_1588684 [Flagelloscypha sp. PMI_526]|nr:hypothetical protein DL96DRAFT_1588684 [Flagelloscypha sp. PMI_526]